MKLLLDTHVFIWLDTNPSKLSQTALALCENPDNQLFLSIASVWEIQIKVQLQKLHLDVELAEMVTVQQEENGLSILPIELENIYNLNSLPFHHKDPFDRVILSQALTNNMQLISADSNFSQYDMIETIW